MRSSPVSQPCYQGNLTYLFCEVQNDKQTKIGTIMQDQYTKKTGINFLVVMNVGRSFSPKWCVLIIITVANFSELVRKFKFTVKQADRLWGDDDDKNFK